MGVVSDRLVFVHIPKTGGTYVTERLEEHMPCNVLWGIKHGVDTAHVSLSHIHNEILGNADPTQYTWCTAVRNPYDRVYSAYVHLHHKESFSEFLQTIDDIGHRPDIHVRPMTHFVTRDDLDTYRVRVLRQETLERDLNDLLHDHCPDAFDTTYRETPYKYLDKYNQADLDKVNKVYDEDFSVFGYNKISSIP